jgi:hypothetical protein
MKRVLTLVNSRLSSPQHHVGWLHEAEARVALQSHCISIRLEATLYGDVDEISRRARDCNDGAFCMLRGLRQQRHQLAAARRRWP